MKKYRKTLYEMRTYLILWASQMFSGLGSAMTAYALVIWSYTQEGSALKTALLMVSSYAPYVVLSIFAGALSDRWDKKRTMLVCDAMAAACTVVTLVLFKQGQLRIWQLYVINMVNGIMNTVQRPASDVAVSRLLPKKYYQKVGGLNYFSRSVNSILTPVIATAILGLAGMEAVIAFDLVSFTVAFLVLAVLIRIPKGEEECTRKEGLLQAAEEGIRFLKEQRGILGLILFLAAINLVASVYEAALPAMILSRERGSEKVLGLVNATVGVTTLLGSILSFFLKEPKSRVRLICNCLLFSMCTENFLLAFGRTPFVWCMGAFLGWIAIPLMSTNLEAILRLHIPDTMQGRVFAVRNSLQFFTIPIGYLLGGLLVDQVFEPFMAGQDSSGLLTRMFGEGKGSGAALLYFVLAFCGIGVCLYFRRNKAIWKLEE
ncbi:MAG: MFS transporter [Lachnospiraceae bacterium]|nr:MFS transporter [Lachnospiraceae bacterium]